jgi:hypothetical protein
MAIIAKPPRKTNYQIAEETARHIRYLWAIADPQIKRELVEG